MPGLEIVQRGQAAEPEHRRPGAPLRRRHACQLVTFGPEAHVPEPCARRTILRRKPRIEVRLADQPERPRSRDVAIFEHSLAA
jgi:hypothetical protein